MAITYGYFNSINGDRKYNAETMAEYFSGLISKGVLVNPSSVAQDAFSVVPESGLTVRVFPGKAYFSDGKWIKSTAEEALTFDTADVVLGRIDRVVLRKDNNKEVRTCSLIIKKGSPSSEPNPPDLDYSDDGNVEELSLAQVYIAPRATEIGRIQITDERPNNDLCGFVHGLIEQIDTTELFKQYEAAFNDWFDKIKEELGKVVPVKQYTSNYTTKSNSEKNIPIQIPQFSAELDILNVYINGLRLVNGVEYTKNATEITLTHPLSKGQVVEFEVLKSVEGN